MARARDPNRDKAFEIYKKHNGKIDLVEIASQLNTPDGTVRGWKSKDKWDNKVGLERNGTERKKERNAPEEMIEISWVDIEQEYITDIRKKPCSLEDLSKKHNISIKTMQAHCQNDKWVDKRIEYRKSVGQKLIEKASDNDADRISKLLRITDIATSKAEQSLNELETFIVKNKKKTKVIEYNNANAVGKPTKEVIEEIEDIQTVQGPVDRQGLLFITNAIKNIKDVYSLDNGAGSDGDAGIKDFLKAIRPSEEDLKDLFADEEVIADGEED